MPPNLVKDRVCQLKKYQSCQNRSQGFRWASKKIGAKGLRLKELKKKYQKNKYYPKSGKYFNLSNNLDAE